MTVPRVVDTSIWVEWLRGGALRARMVDQFPAPDRCLVPTIVQLELSKWLLRESCEDVADQVIAFTESCRVVPLDTRIALLAAEMHRQHKLATADAIVYATARALGADLITCDAHFDGLPDVLYLPKTGV